MAAPEIASKTWYAHVPVLGTDDDFAQLRRLFGESGYRQDAVLDRLQIKTLSDYCHPPEGGRVLRDALDGIVALFFDCSFVDEAALAAVLPPGAVPLMDRLGLLVRDSAPAGSVYTSAAILPAYGLWTACDRGAAPDGSRVSYPPDIVYPGVFDTTARFIDELPATACDSMLDLGTGSGVAALLGARVARHVWATDITGRAVLFTEFNRRLAGADNMKAVEGDLFAPVRGQTFDRITIHPPYVPEGVRRSDHVFAVSGNDGEQIIRRTVESLPEFLRPGGRFYSIQIATDRDGENFEERVRKWLGSAEQEFDVLLALHNRRPTSEFLTDDEHRLFEESRSWVDLWERTHTRFIIYATLLIERHEQPRKPLTWRGNRGVGYSARNLEWLLDWQKKLSGEDHVEMLLACKPLARPENELTVRARLRDGAFRKEEYRLEIPGPFFLAVRCEAWLTEVIPRCDGVRTWRDHFDYLKQEKVIHEDVPVDEFARSLGALMSIGALSLPA